MKLSFLNNKIKFEKHVQHVNLLNETFYFFRLVGEKNYSLWSVRFNIFGKSVRLRKIDLIAQLDKFKRWKTTTKLKLYPFPVYFECNSMDCDTYETTRAYKFKCGYLANKYIDRSYDEAEGWTYWTRLTKDEYNEFQESSRDHRAEYYNY